MAQQKDTPLEFSQRGHKHAHIIPLPNAVRGGDVIGVDLKPTAVAEVDGVPVFECRYGVLNGQYAVKVEKILAVPQSENMLGDWNV